MATRSTIPATWPARSLSCTPGTDVKLSIVRYGDEADVELKLGKFPSGKKLAALEHEQEPAGRRRSSRISGCRSPRPCEVPGAGEEGVVITEVGPTATPPTRA